MKLMDDGAKWTTSVVFYCILAKIFQLTKIPLTRQKLSNS
jgi:hypothetical protein